MSCDLRIELDRHEATHHAGETLTGTVHVVVEKDFVCLTGRDDEDESDMYPHPEADTARC